MSIVFDNTAIEFTRAVGFDGEVEVLNRNTNDLHRCCFRSCGRSICNREPMFPILAITYVSSHRGPMPMEGYQPQRLPKPTGQSAIGFCLHVSCG
jgi:hypothetical protein